MAEREPGNRAHPGEAAPARMPQPRRRTAAPGAPAARRTPSGGGAATRGAGEGAAGGGADGTGEGTGADGSTGSGGLPAPSAAAHHALTSLLGAWALGACSAAENAAVEDHLNDCAACAEEALRLRDAVPLLEPRRSLDLDPGLRDQVLEACLARRPARLPLPSWAGPYDAEAARLDALLHDMAADEWRTAVPLRWFTEGAMAEHATTVAGVMDHLLAVDGLLARALSLPDPLGESAPVDPTLRTHAQWHSAAPARALAPQRAHTEWREQTRALLSAAGRTGGGPGLTSVEVPYRIPELLDGGTLSLPDAFLDRAFACWVHGDDIARAIDYPYGPPQGAHLRMVVDLVARRLAGSLAQRRRAGLALSPPRLTPVGQPGRTVHLEVEGSGGGDWYIPLDSPTAPVSAADPVARVALEDVAFCQLASGRISPDEAAAGTEGDERIVHDLLFAAAALSRL
ncbi:zf-HC2 domain-containing protein [Streptomyces aidingensis]|uniref:Putative zinc-finger n=1 Tax=Streptomyces aidingensis TaxID=910347 RepID=A0A1I1HAP7_9ACTN|nr:zf-HC2 domain-containing protein [Streptomyces aidingensis]SFC20795.1 Putative zinc-finger [Streptomyces aidingensis]